MTSFLCWCPLQASLTFPNERYLLTARTVQEERKKSFQAAGGGDGGRGKGRGAFGGRGGRGSGSGSLVPSWGAAAGGARGSGSGGSTFNAKCAWEALLLVVQVADAFDMLGSSVALQLLEVLKRDAVAGVVPLLSNQQAYAELVARLKVGFVLHLCVSVWVCEDALCHMVPWKAIATCPLPCVCEAVKTLKLRETSMLTVAASCPARQEQCTT